MQDSAWGLGAPAFLGAAGVEAGPPAAGVPWRGPVTIPGDLDGGVAVSWCRGGWRRGGGRHHTDSEDGGGGRERTTLRPREEHKSGMEAYVYVSQPEVIMKHKSQNVSTMRVAQDREKRRKL